MRTLAKFAVERFYESSLYLQFVRGGRLVAHNLHAAGTGTLSLSCGPTGDQIEGRIVQFGFLGVAGQDEVKGGRCLLVEVDRRALGEGDAALGEFAADGAGRVAGEFGVGRRRRCGRARRVGLRGRRVSGSGSLELGCVGWGGRSLGDGERGFLRPVEDSASSVAGATALATLGSSAANRERQVANRADAAGRQPCRVGAMPIRGYR